MLLTLKCEKIVLSIFKMKARQGHVHECSRGQDETRSLSPPRTYFAEDYVMSGSRNRAMEAICTRKENQIFSWHGYGGNCIEHF